MSKCYDRFWCPFYDHETVSLIRKQLVQDAQQSQNIPVKIEAQLLLGQVLFLSGKTDEATSTLSTALNLAQKHKFKLLENRIDEQFKTIKNSG